MTATSIEPREPGSVLVLAGDGIGSEVMGAALRVLNWFNANRGCRFSIVSDSIGGACYDAFGVFLREQTVDAARRADAILVGAEGGPRWDSIAMQLPPEKAEGVFRLRRSLDLFCNIRPVKCLPALVNRSSLKPEVIDGVDLVIVRELTAGVYFGLPRGIQTLANGERDAVDTQRYSTSEIARIAHDAFRIARSRRRRLTSIDKANAMETGRLWRQVVDSIGMSDYPDVAIEHLYADSASMLVVQDPRRFDVILGDNLFGDMISDTASVIAGSPGMLPSASLGPLSADDTRRALYQPMLGASHDLAGRGIVNPMGAILCVAMMFEHSFDMPRERGMIEEAVAEVAHAGIVTPDVGGGASTAMVTSAVVDALSDFG